METWAQLVISFFTGGALVGVLNFIKWFFARRDAQKKSHMTNILEAINDIYHYLHIIKKETLSQRCSIIRIENGGEVPVPGKDLYSSVVYEVYEHNLRPVKNIWQRQKVDEEYIKFLMDIVKCGKKNIRTKELKESILKDLYISQGIIWVEAHKIKVKPGLFFYLSLGYTKDFEPTAYHRNIVRAMVNSISENFKNY